MTTYQVYFRSDLQWGRHDFDAETPAQALALAQRFIAENLDGIDLDFYENCDCPINEIEVCDDEHNSLAVWLDDDMRLRLAAQDLRDAVEFCAMTLYDLEASERKGYIAEAIRLAQAALAKAKGGAA
jgi:hypothetical protein